MPDVTINYKGVSLATMYASGTKTLLTGGSYCEDNISIVYVKPGDGDTVPTAMDEAIPLGSEIGGNG